MSLARFKLVFFCPQNTTKKILGHLFATSQYVGKSGNYEHCAFVSPGTGQFKPLDGAKPAIGSIGQLEYVNEDRVEVLVLDNGNDEEVKAAIRELKNVHPYEEVAYDVIRLENF